MHTTIESDHRKKAFLYRLAKVCLQKLKVNYTTVFLKDAISHTYSLMLEAEYTDEHNRNKVTVADKEDPSNLAIVLLEVLKKYHVKHEVSTIYTDRPKGVCLLVLSSNDKHHNYRDLLSLENSTGGYNGKTIENRVLLKTNEFTGEPGYKLNRNRENLNNIFLVSFSIFLIAILGTTLYRGMLYYPPELWLPPLALLLTGCIVCYHLYKLEKSNTYASRLLKKMCSGKKEFDCKGVISSTGSRLFGIVSQTDIGILYFSSMLSLLLFALFENTYEQVSGLLFLAAVLPLPYTLFSIYYQLRIIKKICMLCLMTQFILWSQFAYFMLMRQHMDIHGISLEMAAQAGVIPGILCLIYFSFYRNPKNKVA